jgi:peptidoglycan-associated lipoprotein
LNDRRLTGWPANPVRKCSTPEHGFVAIRIEGNCDPRGTKEYNMALGERRALSAQNYLIRLGISEARLSTVSYGAERILLHGQNELAWAQNRRADFVAIQ